MVSMYASENKRYYPSRDLDAQSPNSTGNAMMINVMALSRPERGYDMRPRLTQFMDINKYLQCPFTKQMDLVRAGTGGTPSNVEASYAMLWGWRYATAAQTKVQAQQQEKVRTIAANDGEHGMF